MCLFIETIRIDHGRVCNLSRHNRRLNDTRAHFWPESTPLQLSDYLSSPGCGAGITGAGIVKARVVYGEKGIEDLSYSPYAVRHVHSLALMQADTIDYTYKSAGREPLNCLFALRGACDDILIVKQGLLTDTSIANIALSDGTHWYTPAHPLLKGTKRAALLEEGILQEKDIRPEDLPSFSTVRLFNAMIDWGELEHHPVEPLLVHIVEMYLQRLHRYIYFVHRYGQRNNQQYQRQTEDIGRKQMETDIDKEHADHAQQQAADARHLHGTRQVEPLPQVGNLRRLHRRRVLHVLFLQGAHQLGIGQETVGIGQHNQRYGRKQQGGGG